MSKTPISKLLISIAILMALLFFSYTYFLKDIYWNNQTKEVQISKLPMNKPVELKKHAAQKNISSIEIEIKGSSDNNIYLLFGSSEKEMVRQYQIKKGTIDFSTASDWYQDNCYLYVTSDAPQNVDLQIEYRFIGGAN